MRFFANTEFPNQNRAYHGRKTRRLKYRKAEVTRKLQSRDLSGALSRHALKIPAKELSV